MFFDDNNSLFEQSDEDGGYLDTDILSMWEVPSIAHYFDIEELEEALLTHTVEEVGSSLIQDLIVRLLKGCFNSNKDEITSSNYQMYLRRLFRKKCSEDHNRNNPFNRDVAFHSLPLRTKVQILYDLCDFRLDSDEVQDVLKSLESHSLRVTALGKDSGGSTYWYFYGTRLYREDYNNSPTSSPARKRGKRLAELNGPVGSLVGSKWQVVCFTEEDWQLLTRKFKNCSNFHEQSLHRTLTCDFLPELPRLFAEKEKLQRKRMMEQQLRRSSRNNVSTNSGNVGSKSASDEPSGNQTSDDMSEEELKRKRLEQEKADRLLAEEMQREERKARIHLRERRGGSASSGSGFGSANNSQSSVSAKKSAAEKANRKRMTNNSMAACLPPVMKVDDSNSNSPVATTPRRDSRSPSPEPPPPPSSTTTTTNTTTTANNKVNKNSQSSANHSSVSKPKKKKYDEAFTKDSKKEGSKSGMSKTKVKSSIIFSQTEEDVIIGMHKVIEAMKNHSEAWPFLNPVDEDYAPNYYRVISHPMDLQAIEDKLDNLEYSSLEEFKGDFQTIVDNCRKYNGPSSEYTEMVENLQDAFNKCVQRYIVPDESDEEIFSIEYNTGNDRKRPRVSSPAKNAEKTPEHKKENEPRKTKAPIAKSKLEKHDKKKRNQQRKQQLMRHHSRNSEAMDALSSATAETLKDINKWLGDTPKISEYSSPSPCSVSSDVVLRGEKKVEDVRSAKPKVKSIKGTKRKLAKDDRDDSSSSPKTTKNNNNNKNNSKDQVKTKKPKVQKETSTTDKESIRGASSSRSNSKDKDKHHHHHRHHKHRHHRPQSTTTVTNDREQSASPERNRGHNNQANRRSRKTEESGSGSGGKTKRHPSPTRNSPHRNTTSGKSGVNHSMQQGGGNSRENLEKSEVSSRVKHSETSKSTTKSPAKRGGGNSLIQGIKSSGTIKRLQGNKGTKYSANHHHQDSKFKGGGGGNANASVYDFALSNSSYSTSKSYLSNSDFNAGQSCMNSSNNSSGGREPTSEKKKCLLINDCSSGKEGGPRLSLGSVLSTDAIKLGDYKKDDVFSDDEDNVQCSGSSKGEKTKTDKFDDLKAKVQSKIKSSPDADDDTKSNVKGEEVVKGEVKKDAEEEELESDRKLEPSKGFNRDKCMPNLSAWIKAFGGPAKTATPNVTSTPTKKSDGGDPPKSKFKVLGRAQVETSEDRSKHSSVKAGSANSTQSSSKGGKGEESKKNQNTKTVGGDYSLNAGNDDIGGSQSYEHHHQQGATSSNSNKRHRSRNMSTSSLSSQSESGSPSCFPANQDDQFGNRYGGGILNNPPRWVDDHWASNHSQSQSPSASSHVSSQSPAEPFSPPMSSPPRTPQTPPPWTSAAPVPVRVGFYQDLTSQHSSPEKMAETNTSNAYYSEKKDNAVVKDNCTESPEPKKNVVGWSPPSTPPSVAGSSNGNNNGSSGAPPPNSNGSKNYGASYPSQQPYAPPPRYATSIPSPNIGSNLPSPSPGTNTNVDSPGNRSSSLSMGSPHSPNVANSAAVHPSDYSRLSLTSTSPGHPQPQGGPSTASQPGKPPLSSQAMSPVLRPQLTVPYPVTSINSSGNFMMESNHPVHSHSHSPHPENAHVRHHHPTPGPPRYAHSLIPAHHHQPVTLSSQSPSLPSSSSSATIATSAYSQGHPSRQTMQGLPPTLSSSSQPQYTNSNPYTSNPRSINVAPSVYNDPIGPDTVQHRYYGPPTATPSASSSSTKSRRSAAAAAHSSDVETSKNSPTVSSAAAAVLESAKLSSELNVNGFQWPHNLASLSQIVNSIPGTMTAGMVPNAYRAHYDASVATSSPGMENMSKFPRSEPSGYTNLTTSGGGKSGVSSGAGAAASTNQEKGNANESSTERRSSSKSESKSSRSQGSNSKNSSQPPIVPGSAFNFSALTPDLSMYSKEMSDRMTSDPSSIYSSSPPSLAHHHRPDLYPTSTANFHTSFAAASAARTTAGGVPAASIAPYQIPPFISHPSPYQPQSVSSQPFAHTQSPRGMVDPYQPFFQGSPHVMGLLPPSGLPHPLSIKYDEHGSKHSEDLRNGWIHPHHSLGFNRPGWI